MTIVQWNAFGKDRLFGQAQLISFAHGAVDTHAGGHAAVEAVCS
jgi:hypothetical protein